MDIQVQIDKKAVEAQIVQAVMASALGEHVDKAVKKAFEAPGFSRSSFVETAIQQALYDCIRSIAVQEVDKFKDLIKAKVSEKLTDDVVDSFVSKAWERFTKD